MAARFRASAVSVRVVPTIIGLAEELTAMLTPCSTGVIHVPHWLSPALGSEEGAVAAAYS